MSDATPFYGGTTAGWRGFWNRGGWWRAVLVAIVYLAIYLGLGQLAGLLFAGVADRTNPLATPESVFLGVALPIIVIGLLTVAFIVSQRWQREIFGPQPRSLSRPWWMWIAVAIVIIPAVLRLAGTDWAAKTAPLVLSILFLGLCIGFAEELITRGIVVDMLRRGGYSERVVMLLSSLVFGLLHSTNVLSGQAPLTVGITVVYAFGFGAMMYLSMRVTGSIIPAMLLHAATDPTTILAVGGLDASAPGGVSPLATVAGVFSFVYIAAALVAIPFVRGRVQPRQALARG